MVGATGFSKQLVSGPLYSSKEPSNARGRLGLMGGLAGHCLADREDDESKRARHTITLSLALTRRETLRHGHPTGPRVPAARSLRVWLAGGPRRPRYRTWAKQSARALRDRLGVLGAATATLETVRMTQALSVLFVSTLGVVSPRGGVGWWRGVVLHATRP